MWSNLANGKEMNNSLTRLKFSTSLRVAITIREAFEMTKRMIRRRDVESMIGLSKSTIYDMMKRGEFPKPVRVGKRAVAWSESRKEADTEQPRLWRGYWESKPNN